MTPIVADPPPVDAFHYQAWVDFVGGRFPVVAGGDIYAAIAAAASAGGGLVTPGPGLFQLPTPLLIPSNVQVLGSGPGTVLRATGNNYIASFTGTNSRISNLALDAAATQTAGGGIDYTNAGSDTCVDHISILGRVFTSFNLIPAAASSRHFIDHILWDAVHNCKWGFLVGDGTHLLTDVFVSNVIGGAATTADMDTWLWLHNATDTIKFRSVDFYQGANGVIVGDVAANTPSEVELAGVTADSMTGYGYLVNKVRGLDLLNPTISTCGTFGLDIGANAKAVHALGGKVQNCAGTGAILRNGAIETELIGTAIADNNTANGAFGFGIEINAGASEWKVIGVASGNYLLGTGHQKYGLVVDAGASDHYHIVNNRWNGNESGGLADNGTGVNKVVTGNL